MAISATIPEHLKKKQAEKPDPNKRKGWGTPYGFADFTEPVTYEHACQFMQEQSARFAKLFESAPTQDEAARLQLQRQGD